MTETNESSSQPNFSIQKIFVKDVSFESPNTPEIFLEQGWQPDVNLNLQSQSRQLGDNIYEVVLNITVTAKLDDEKIAYLVEVQQAGIFNVTNFSEEDIAYMLGSYTPNVLFPFAREVIADLVSKGGFPQMLVAPVNFDALFHKQMQEQQGEAAEAEPEQA